MSLYIKFLIAFILSVPVQPQGTGHLCGQAMKIRHSPPKTWHTVWVGRYSAALISDIRVARRLSLVRLEVSVRPTHQLSFKRVRHIHFLTPNKHVTQILDSDSIFCAKEGSTSWQEERMSLDMPQTADSLHELEEFLLNPFNLYEHSSSAATLQPDSARKYSQIFSTCKSVG
jgi:hypothetical protein